MQFAKITRCQGQNLQKAVDAIAIEQPLAIDIVYGKAHNRNVHRLAVTMRTPGYDKELALGLLFSLGIIETKHDVNSISPCLRNKLKTTKQATLLINLHEKVLFNAAYFEAGHPRYSSCGICGSVTLNTSCQSSAKKPAGLRISTRTLIKMADLMAQEQVIFQQTGGTHAAALFDEHSNLIQCFEDVGRHNALDKVIGALLSRNQLPLDRHVLLLSSRASFEIVQKASRAGIDFVAVMGAISSFALALAHEHKITLVGFLRADRCNIYTHGYRVIADQE